MDGGGINGVWLCGWMHGGGPYGQQVTRGQDLTWKDFSGQTLIKKDFKTGPNYSPLLFPSIPTIVSLVMM
uniref:Uncharacterized protein n=1 Tax=Triticum aestivum TaxID=4565 RepID=A0A080YTU7_WHEAT|nr:unnamed protein product [Triticum aestivum]